MTLLNDLESLGALNGQLVATAERYLRAVASRNRHAKQYGEQLAHDVLELAVVGLARGVLEGGPLTYSCALRLAEAIMLADAQREEANRRWPRPRVISAEGARV